MYTFLETYLNGLFRLVNAGPFLLLDLEVGGPDPDPARWQERQLPRDGEADGSCLLDSC